MEASTIRAQQAKIAAIERPAATEQGDVTRLHGVEPPEWQRLGAGASVRIYDGRTIHVPPRGQAYHD